MFDQDKAVAKWRREMNILGMKNRSVLDELESHLREDAKRRMQSGTAADLAFRLAIARLGPSRALTDEFSKVGELNDFSSRIKYFFLTLAGIQNPTLATTMNTSISNGNGEPAWASYVKSGAFALPATFLWLFVTVFVFPKFNEVLSGSRDWMPGMLRFGWDLALLLRHDLFFICVAGVTTIGLLEWRSANWRRYRKPALAMSVFFLNSAVLLAITAMTVLSLMVASELARHAK